MHPSEPLPWVRPLDAIAAASQWVETVIFGPADFMTSLNLQAIDGPYLQIREVEGFREVARRSAALGFDGKWVLHPGQVEVANEVYAPTQADYDHAELILDAYEYFTSEAGGAR